MRAINTYHIIVEKLRYIINFTSVHVEQGRNNLTFFFQMAHIITELHLGSYRLEQRVQTKLYLKERGLQSPRHSYGVCTLVERLFHS